MSAITPELALIDPEFAVAARALLPEPGQFRPASAWGADSRRLPLVPPESRPVAAGVAPARSGSRATIACVLAATVVAAAVVGVIVGRPDGGLTRATPDLEAASGALLRARATRQARVARTYTWPAVPGAVAYQVEVMRDGQPIYEATTSRPALRLPADLALSPGRYTFSATPRSNRSLPDPAARPVIEEAFQVTSS